MKSNHIKDVISLGELIVKYKNWKFNIGTMLLGRILIFWEDPTLLLTITNLLEARIE